MRTALLLGLLLLAGCDFFNANFEEIEDGQLYQAGSLSPVPAESDRLLVMTWNIKFGGGRIDFFYDCYDTRVLMTEEEVLANLEGLAAKINQVNPDILLLQEVDVQSKRSAYIDQVQWLLDHTLLNYGAYASQWKPDFIPSDGLGRMNSGIAVLSKRPITESRRITLPERTGESALTNYFYLKRAVLTTRIPLPQREDFFVVTTHLEAYSKDDTKQRQLNRLIEELDRIEALGALMVLGGDFNMIPPGSQQLKDFPDAICEDEEFIADDFSGEVGWMDPLYEALQPAIPTAVYTADNASYFTHTVDGDGFWNRTLDYLFTNGSWVPGSGLVHQDAVSGGMATMPLSDHAPVTALLEVNP